jgi:60Kd inner membrane protein
MAMQKLQPKVKEIQNRYKNDQEKAQLEVARLYREAQVHLKLLPLLRPKCLVNCLQTAAQHEQGIMSSALPTYCRSTHWLGACQPSLPFPCSLGCTGGMLHCWHARRAAGQSRVHEGSCMQGIFASSHWMSHHLQSIVECCGRGSADRGLLLDPLAGRPNHAGCSESGAHCHVLRCMSPECAARRLVPTHCAVSALETSATTQTWGQADLCHCEVIVLLHAQGGGFSWLLPLQDGAPPVGWADAIAYLSLPVLLVVSQFVSQKLISPPQSNDPSQQSSQWILKFLPFMIGEELL